MFYIVSVSPLTKIKNIDVLEYFSSKKTPIGSLVLIQLGKRKEKAIVLSIKDLKEKKVEIKNSQFKLKPILKIISKKPVLNKQQIELGKWISEYYLSPLGSCLKMFLPKSILNRKTEIKDINIKNAIVNKKQKPLLLWSENRIEYYKKEIKKAKQILFIVPENHDLETYKKLFDFTIVTSQLTTKQELDIYKNVPKLILGTRKSLFLPFINLDLIIIDQEENDSYKSWDQHPKYQTRTTALKLADIHGCKMILGTSFPDVTTYHYADKKIFDFKKDIINKSLDLTVINMKNENYTIFSRELESQLKKVNSAAILVNRKGMATALKCRECGHIIQCPNCNIPMVYYSDPNHLLCHYCKFVQPAPDICPKCKGIEIKYIGTGIQKVQKELEKIGIQSQSIDTNTKYNGSNFIVGTQTIFNLKRKFDLGVVLLLDPMVNRPEYRTMEKTIQTLNNFKRLCKKTIVQTYNPDNFILHSNFTNFFKQDIKLRKSLDYPPFSKLIRLNLKEKDIKKGAQIVNQTKEKLEKLFTKTKILGPSPSFIPRIHGKYSWDIILKTKTKDLTILRNILDPAWEIDVDPQTLI